MSKEYWQIAAGDRGRDYADKFIRHGIAFVGGEDCVATMREVAVGSVMLLKEGKSQLLAAGEVVERKGIHRGEDDKDWLRDFDGWDLRAWCYVNWRVPSQPVPVEGLARGTIKRVYQEEPRKLAHSLLSLPVRSPEPEPEATQPVSDEQILEHMITQGLRPSAADELTNTIRKIRLLANYYYSDIEYEWEEVREHETRTFLVVPMLLALGWPEQQMKIELPCAGGKIDIACYPRPYQGRREDCTLLIETKGFGQGLDYAPEQAKSYAADFPNCRALMVTNGYCYKTFIRVKGTDSFADKPSAYLNLLRPRDRYPLDPQQTDGALGVIKWLLPSSLQ